jgi:hypothetical protein
MHARGWAGLDWLDWSWSSLQASDELAEERACVFAGDGRVDELEKVGLIGPV